MARIKFADGIVINFNGEPTPQDIDEAYSNIKKQSPKEEPKMVGGMFGKISEDKYNEGERNIVGNIAERPGAANREAIRANPALFLAGPVANISAGYGLAGDKAKEATKRASINPSTSPTFQKEFLDKYSPNTSNTALNFIGGIPASTAGLAADIWTNPLDILGMIAGKTPIGGKTATGAGRTLGDIKPVQAVNRFIEKERTIPSPSEIGKSVSDVGTKVYETVTPKFIQKKITKYQTSKKPIEEREIKQGFRKPLERVKNLEEKALKEKQGLIDTESQRSSLRLKKVEDISKRMIQEEDEVLAKKLKITSDKGKQELADLNNQYQTTAEKSSLEYKNRIGKIARENSDSYGTHLDEVSEKAGDISSDDLKSIFDKTDAEIADTFIDSGAPLQKYKALKDKYTGSGFNEATNPEAASLAKALGIKKGNLANSGIDFSKSTFKPPEAKPLSFKEIVKDIRSVSKSMSSGAKGALRQYTDEDIINNILQKNFGEYASTKVPEFGELQKSYSPIIEQMKAGRKIFKPGAPYDLGTGPKVLKSPDIVEQKLISELEQGTPGFNKGVGEVSEPVVRARQKIEGKQRGYDIAKEKITSASETAKESILRRTQGIKEKIISTSKSKQDLLQEALDKRLFDLEKGKTLGKERIESIVKRKQITDKEKKIATGGGAATILDYAIRRALMRGLMR